MARVAPSLLLSVVFGDNFVDYAIIDVSSVTLITCTQAGRSIEKVSLADIPGMVEFAVGGDDVFIIHFEVIISSLNINPEGILVRFSLT